MGRTAIRGSDRLGTNPRVEQTHKRKVMRGRERGSIETLCIVSIAVSPGDSVISQSIAPSSRAACAPFLPCKRWSLPKRNSSITKLYLNP